MKLTMKLSGNIKDYFYISKYSRYLLFNISVNKTVVLHPG